MIHRLKMAMTALCLTLCSQAVLALGLGEVTLLSKLNQPLNAEIELLQLRDLSEEEVLIALASREDFARIGIDRPYFLTDLTFKADLSNPNKPKVIVKSKKIVQEPFLNFIVQAQWPSGKILREYTLLLDLPVFSQRQAPTISSAKSAPVPQAPAQVRRSAPQSPSRQTGDTVTVAPDETLWEIARQVRPSNGYSIQQTMLALQRLNPDAFINNNINLLKKGQVLRIPDANDITLVDQQVAVTNVAQQNAQWSSKSNNDDDDLGAQLSAVKEPTPQNTTSTDNEGRLKLVSPEASTDNTAGKLSGAGDSQSEALKSELAVTLEELEKTSRDNSDLRTQVQSLEDQITTLESLIDVTNEDMRALELAANKREQDLLEQQENLSAEKEAELTELKASAAQAEADALANIEAAQALADQKAQALEEAAAEEAAAIEAETLAQDDEAVVDVITDTEASANPVDDLYAQTQETEELSEEIEQEVAETKPAPIKAPESRVKKTSIIDMLMDNILYLAIAFIVLVAGVLFWIQSRAKNDEDDDFESNFDESAFMADIPDGENSDDTVVMGDSGISDSEDLSENEFAPSDIDADLNSDGHQVEAQTANAATESEIYISLGQFDEAENLLLDALSEDSRNLPVKLKLLEVYAAQNASVKFNEFYADVIASGGQVDIARANDLRATVEGIDDVAVVGEHDDIEDDKTQLQFHSQDEGMSALDNMADAQPVDETISIDDSLEQMSESLEQGDLTELDLNLDDIDDLVLDDISDQDHTEVLNDTVDLDSGLGNLGLADDALDTPTEVEDIITPTQKAVDVESLTNDDLLGATGLASEKSLDDEMAQLDDELSLDSELDLLGENASSASELEAELDLGLDDFDVDSANKDLSADELNLDDLDLDNLDGEAVDSADELSLDLDDVELDSVSLGEKSLASSKDLDLSKDADVDLELNEENNESAKDSAVEVDDLSLDDLLDSSHNLDASVDDVDLDDLDLDLDSLDEASDSVSADDMLSELDLELDLGQSDMDLDKSLSVDDDVEVRESTIEATQKDSASLNSDEGDEIGAKAIETLDSADDLDLDDLALELEAETVADKDNIEDLPSSDELDDDFGFLNDSDEIATKLDLALAYIDMGDRSGAKEIIEEILEEGNEVQQKEAKELLKKIS